MVGYMCDYWEQQGEHTMKQAMMNCGAVVPAGAAGL
jgi:hypothetical protein